MGGSGVNRGRSGERTDTGVLLSGRGTGSTCEGGNGVSRGRFGEWTDTCTH